MAVGALGGLDQFLSSNGGIDDEGKITLDGHEVRCLELRSRFRRARLGFRNGIEEYLESRDRTLEIERGDDAGMQLSKIRERLGPKCDCSRSSRMVPGGRFRLHRRRDVSPCGLECREGVGFRSERVGTRRRL